MRQVLLVANLQKDGAEEEIRIARRVLEGRAEILDTVTDPQVDLSDCDAEMVVVFGGDGTVLNVVQRLGENEPLMLTVNFGRLGFLAEVLPEELETMLERVLNGHYRVSERMLLHGRLMENGEERWHGHALNEITVAASCPVRMVQMVARVDGKLLTRLASDGLIVSTPTGSTAYALSAGGPVLNPELHAMLLVPICPHFLANRPLVLSENEVLTVSLLDNGPLQIVCDGQVVGQLGPEAWMEMKCSRRVVRMICGESLGRYDILRAKLGWGGENCDHGNPALSE